MQISKSIRILIMAFCFDAVFFVPILVAYYNSKGVDFIQFIFIVGFMKLCLLFFEIPLSYISDKSSRTLQLKIFAVFWIIYLFLMIKLDGFIPLLLIEIICAISLAFYSGTLEAYYYETIKLENRDLQKYQSYLFGCQVLAMVFSVLCGGYLYDVNKDLPVFLTIIFSFIGFFILIKMPEHTTKKEKPRSSSSIYDILLIIKFVLKDNKKLRFIILSSVLISTITGITFWLFQHILSQKMTATEVGYLLSFGFLLKFLFICLVPLITSKFRKRPIFLGFSVLLAFGCLFMSFENNILFYLGGFICAFIIQGFFSPIFANMINMEIKDSERATILSIATFIKSLLSGIFYILFSYILKTISLSNIFMIMFCLVLLFFLLLLFKKQEQE